MLTDEEREQIDLACIADWKRGWIHPDRRNINAAVESIIAARVRAARAQDAEILNQINLLTGRPVFGNETEPDVLYVRNADIVNLFDADWLRDHANHIESSQNG